jgi:hypothetical protein
MVPKETTSPPNPHPDKNKQLSQNFFTITLSYIVMTAAIGALFLKIMLLTLLLHKFRLQHDMNKN